MICLPCRYAADLAHLLPFSVKDGYGNWYNPQSHDNCIAIVRGKTWCDCQHKPAKKSPELEEYLNGQRPAQGGDKAPESA